MTEQSSTIEVRDGGDGAVLGYVCLDSLINGKARGGLRMVPDLSRDEVEKLARAMTLKYGFLGLPQGGGKAGVFGDPEAPAAERAAVLRRFATAAGALLRERRYVPDADMGTSGAEIQQMLEGIGVRVARREYRGSASGEYTAATVFASAREAAAAQGLEWTGCRVVIEGFGKVGGPLALMCMRSGARVVAVSTRAGGVYLPSGLDVASLMAEGFDGCGTAERVDVQCLKGLPADIFCPCARHDSVRLEDVPRLQARVVSCGANSPVTPEAERALWERGVLCVPDFVANCGGVLGGTMEFAGWRGGEILEFCERVFRQRVRRLIVDARREGLPVREFAEAQARPRFADVKRRAEEGSWGPRIARLGLAAYREGWVPARLMRWMSEGYFRRAANS